MNAQHAKPLTYGLTKQIVQEMSARKNEPSWMRELRLSGYDEFIKQPLPSFGPDLSGLDTTSLCFFNAPYEKPFQSWQDVPDDIKQTFSSLGIPDHEQKLFAGLGAQYESEMMFHELKERWNQQGVIFCSMDEAVNLYPELVQRYFGSLVPASDNKFAALNYAVWSGGSFIYVPANVHVELPMHAYFRMQAERMGQFERTLIIAESGSTVHYIEGCSAPLYSTNALHAAVVEIIANDNAQVRYTTIQNWSRNVFNLVTKRAIAHFNASIEWVDGNFGSQITMKYPCIILAGKKAKGSLISLSRSSDNQVIDSGAKFIHQAAQTRSHCLSKSIVQGTGKSTYRGLVVINENAIDSISFTQCDSLLLDSQATVDAYPMQKVTHNQCAVSHEASVSALDDEQMLYCMSRGITRQSSRRLIINGFADAFVQELPLEYAVELGRLLALDIKEQS